MNDNFKEIQSAYRAWWEELQEDKGAKARLRRCASLTDVALEPAYYRLQRSFFSLKQGGREETVMALAALGAHVKTAVSGLSMAKLMAQPKGGVPGEDNQIVKEGRFQRLLKVEERGELMLDLIRVIRLLDDKANLEDLAQGLWFWGDKVKRQWAKDYFTF